MLSNWLADTSRLVGPLVQLDADDLSLSYDDQLIGPEEWQLLSQRALLTSRTLLSALADRQLAFDDVCSVHALNALGSPVLRVVLPEDSMVDRAADCGLASLGLFVDATNERKRCDAVVKRNSNLQRLSPMHEVSFCGKWGAPKHGVLGADDRYGLPWLAMRREEKCVA